jgi:drug/metabolite transporter (DMT)-like permease
MNEEHRPRRILQSIGAVLAGLIAIVALSIGTDWLINVLGIFPTIGQPMGDALLLLATVYRTVYSTAGSYLAARLAPDRPMMHALALGVVGLVLSIVGAVVAWNTGPSFGPAWYPLALVALAMPSAWAGGRIREMKWDTRTFGG